MHRFLATVIVFAISATAESALARNSAGALVSAAANKARDASTWEAEGTRVLTTANGAVNMPFRIALDRDSIPPVARLEILGGPAPLVRICDGNAQLTWLLPQRQYWSLPDRAIDPCAWPFMEWTRLASAIQSPVVVGKETLKVSHHAAKCSIVQGDYVSDGSPSTRRLIWIEDETKIIWKYQVAGPAGSNSSDTYTFSWHLLNGARRSPDLWKPPDLQGSAQIAPLKDDALFSGPASTGSLPKDVFRIGGAIVQPVLTLHVDPDYPPDLRRSKIEGSVSLEAEVWPDGKPHNVKVIRSLDVTLDGKAIEAVSQWRFRPGTRDGVPVPVRINVEVGFHLL